jgi:hypothetical protein
MTDAKQAAGTRDLENLLLDKLFRVPMPKGVYLKALTLRIRVWQPPMVEIQRIQTGSDLEIFPPETYEYLGEPIALERLPSLLNPGDSQ